MASFICIPKSLFIWRTNYSGGGIFAKCCVAIFCCITGYGMYKSLHKTNSFLERCKISLKHLLKFYSGYWVILLVFIPLGLVLGKCGFSLKAVLLSIVGISKAYNTEWWFIKDYVLFLVCVPVILCFMDLIDRMLAKRKIKPDAVYFAILLFVYISNELLADSILYRVSRWVPCFLSGVCMARCNWVEAFNKLKYKEVLSVLFIIAFYFLRPMINPEPVDNRLDFILVPIFIMSCMVVVHKLSVLQKPLAYFGKHSANIWLIHTFFIYYYFKELFMKINVPIITFAAVLCVSLLSSCILCLIQDVFYKGITNCFGRLTLCK